MFENIAGWPHWGVFRFATGLLVALATCATVIVGIWTVRQQQDATDLERLQNSVIFDIVNTSATEGVTLDEVRRAYVDRMRGEQLSDPLAELEDDDIREMLLRQSPTVVLVAERWYHAANSPQPERSPVIMFRERLDRIEPLVDDIRTSMVTAESLQAEIAATAESLQAEIAAIQESGSAFSILIEAIDFGIPQIPSTYRDRSLRRSEIQELLRPIVRADEILTLTAREVLALNRITNVSAMAGRRLVTSDTTYDMETIVNLFVNAFAFYYEYSQWSSITRDWSQFLGESTIPLDERFRTFVDDHVGQVSNGAGIFNAIVGTANIPRRSIDLTYSDSNCLQNGRETGVRVDEDGDDLSIDWGNFRSRIAVGGQRREATKQLVAMLQKGCAEDLSRVFSEMSGVFTEELPYMAEYIDTWNAVFSAREPTSLSMTVTVLNLGSYDTYIRRDIRAGVGVSGSPDKTLVTLTAASGEDSVPEGPYLPVGTRNARTYRFRASVDETISGSLKAAFESNLAYVKVGVLVGSGESRQVVFSPVTPFSTHALARAREEVDSIPIDF